jgi:hypothetical protein
MADDLEARLLQSAEYLTGESEADRELAPFVVANQNTVTLGITATHEFAAKACREAALEIAELRQRKRALLALCDRIEALGKYASGRVAAKLMREIITAPRLGMAGSAHIPGFRKHLIPELLEESENATAALLDKAT